MTTNDNHDDDDDDDCVDDDANNDNDSENNHDNSEFSMKSIPWTSDATKLLCHLTTIFLPILQVC